MAARLRGAFLAAALGFMAVMAVRAVSDGGVTLPSWPTVWAAAALACLSLLACAAAWVVLLDADVPPRTLGAAFLAGQMGKYIPGGVWVGVGHFGFGAGMGLPAMRTAAALGVYGICMGAAAGVVAGLAALLEPAAAPVLLPGLVLPMLLYRRWSAALAALISSRLPAEVGRLELPGQRPMLRGFLWLVPAIACSAAAFALLLGAGASTDAVGTLVGAFAAAWLTGFIAIGLPGGIGAREGVLVLLLDADPGTIVAASIAHRLVQAVVEALLLLAVRRHLPDAASPPGRSDLPVTTAWRLS